MAWAVQVAMSLHCLHWESRLRHGDVTLRNVLLGRDGRACLADMGVAEHNQPYGRQPQQRRRPSKGYSASVAPEMEEEQAEELSPSDARADVWSWGVLLHALLTRSTAMATGNSVSAYLTMIRDEAVAPWGPENKELPAAVLKVLKHSLCERAERVGLLAGAVLLGQLDMVVEVVQGMEAPEHVKRSQLCTALLESSMGATPDKNLGRLSPVDLLTTLAASHHDVGDEAQAIACLQQAARFSPPDRPVTSSSRMFSSAWHSHSGGKVTTRGP
jgi:hypothetical protein